MPLYVRYSRKEKTSEVFEMFIKLESDRYYIQYTSLLKFFTIKLIDDHYDELKTKQAFIEEYRREVEQYLQTHDLLLEEFVNEIYEELLEHKSISFPEYKKKILLKEIKVVMGWEE